MKTVLANTPDARLVGAPASLSDSRQQARPPISSQQLFAGRQEIIIAHGDGLYQLRQTRSGKLILTK